jgi:hypothetical protein
MINKKHQWSGRLARSCQFVARRRLGVRLQWRPHILHKPTSQPMGATWQPMTGPHCTMLFTRTDATCQQLTGPLVCQVVNSVLPRHPCQHATVSATSAYATCHPYSGDMCHPLIGPVPVVCHITYHVSSPGAATSVVRPIQSACHVALYRLYSRPFFFFFACLGF